MRKSVAALLAVTSLSLAVLPPVAEAKRLGGGKPVGMQRDSTPAQAPANATPAQPAGAGQQANQVAPKQAAAPTPATPPTAAPKRSWLGPIAGLAAGLGLAALMSHLGLGEAFGNFLMMALLVLVAAVAVGLLMKWLRRKPGQAGSTGASGPASPWAMAGATAGGSGAAVPSTPAARQGDGLFARLNSQDGNASGSGSGSGFAAVQKPSLHTPTTTLPDFDAAGFERVAKALFIRLQAANDAGNLDDLRKFTTPELFASLRLDLLERSDSRQQTDVVELNATLVEAVEEGAQHIVTMRFSGLIREDVGGAAVPFDERWHLLRPADGSRDWAIAGITPNE